VGFAEKVSKPYLDPHDEASYRNERVKLAENNMAKRSKNNCSFYIKDPINLDWLIE
jgi:hypothetical protein